MGAALREQGITESICIAHMTETRYGLYKKKKVKLIFIGVQLLYNVVLVSAVRQNQSAMHIHVSPSFWTSFPFLTGTQFPRKTGILNQY